MLAFDAMVRTRVRTAPVRIQDQSGRIRRIDASAILPSSHSPLPQTHRRYRQAISSIQSGLLAGLRFRPAHAAKLPFCEAAHMTDESFDS